jgi:hypothetical protein
MLVFCCAIAAHGIKTQQIIRNAIPRKRLLMDGSKSVAGNGTALASAALREYNSGRALAMKPDRRATENPSSVMGVTASRAGPGA